MRGPYASIGEHTAFDSVPRCSKAARRAIRRGLGGLVGNPRGGIFTCDPGAWFGLAMM